MTFNSYQNFTRTTAFYPQESAIGYCALGLAGEAGEVANNVKKIVRDKVDKTAAIVDELGDVLWYIARLADELGVDLSDVVDFNVEKLERRTAERRGQGTLI